MEYGKKKGDFKVDGKYTFEVGGPGKDFKQIAGVPDSYILADDTDYPKGWQSACIERTIRELHL